MNHCFKNSGPRDFFNTLSHKQSLTTPREVERWWLTTVREKLNKIGAGLVRQGRYVALQIATVAIPSAQFAEFLYLIDRLRPALLPP